MTQINLLPWREELRQQKTREFVFILIGSVILSAVLLLFVHMFMANKIRQQRGVNEFLQQHIAALDKQISEIKTLQEQKQSLLNRMNIVQRLQLNRPLAVHLFDDFVRIIPSGVYITSVKRTGSTISIKGKAESNTRVSELMRNIEKSKWVYNPVLTEIKSEEEDGSSIRTRVFELQMQQSVPSLMAEHVPGQPSVQRDPYESIRAWQQILMN